MGEGSLVWREERYGKGLYRRVGWIEVVGALPKWACVYGEVEILPPCDRQNDSCVCHSEPGWAKDLWLGVEERYGKGL